MLAGDTFTVQRGFDFGDSAIVDNNYYVSTFRTEQLVTPTTIIGHADFAVMPVLDGNDVLLTTHLALGGTDNQVLTRTSTGMEWEDTASAVTTFLGLGDTPSAFGSVGQAVRVATGGTALEFYTPTSGGATTFLGLTDTPSAIGAMGQVVTVNAGGTALEFADIPSGATGDITSVTTATNSGIQGGETTGDVALSLDFDSLPDITGANIFVGDLFVVRDANGGTNPYKSITQQHLATTFADNVTIQQSGGELRIRPLSVTAAHITDDTITEVKLSIGNAPSTNNLLGWDGSEMQWIDSIAPATWAVENNLDLIPFNKFDDAHTPLDWASTGNTDDIPFGKIPGTLIHLATAVTYAQQAFTVTTDNTVELGDLILLETPSAWTENDLPVQMRVNGTASVALTDREESGLLDSEIDPVTWYLITRNTNASTWSVVTSLSGLNLGQVRNQIADWAETGNTDDIPFGKIPGTLIHMATAVTYAAGIFTVTTENSVEIGDLILLETPTVWTENNADIGLNVNGIGAQTLTDRFETALQDNDISPETWYLITRNTNTGEWSIVTSLRGLSIARVRDEIADWAETSNTDLIPTSKIPGLAREVLYYQIDEGNVGGSGNVITLNTGQSLTVYPHGMMVYFRATANNTGDVTINVDSIGSRPFVQANIDTFAQFPGSQLTTGTSILAVYDDANTRFVWAGGGIGAAAKRLVGTAAGNLVAVNATGRISDNVLNTNIVRTTGATFTGAVAGITPVAGTDFTTKSYVDAGGATASAYVVIDDLQVSGTNVISLTTGRSYSIIPHGLLVSFNPVNNHSGPLRIEIDGLASRSFVKSDGSGGSIDFVGGDIRVGEVTFAYYDSPAGTFYWVGSYIGTAGRRSTGTDSGNLAVLGTGGRFDASQLPSDVAYSSGATFTGAVSGIAPTTDSNFATRGYVDAADGPYYPIEDSNVGGTRDEVTLNTTQSLAA